MNVFQIIIGILPEELIPYVDSVKNFAEKNNHSYRVITETPEQYAMIQDPRIISNNMRVDELCKDPEACYFDWDVLLSDNFNFSVISKPKINSSGMWLCTPVIQYSGYKLENGWETLKNTPTN